MNLTFPLTEDFDAESDEGKDLSDVELKKIAQDHADSVQRPSTKPHRGFFVISVGLIAAGKTTIMKALAKRLDLLIIRTDDIRRLLLSRGFNLLRTREIAEQLARQFANEGYAIGIDADGAGDYVQEHIRSELEAAKIPVAWLHVTAPEKLILERLDERNTDRDYRGEEAIENYYRRKPLHENLTMPFTYTFDTSKNLDEQLDEAEIAIRTQLGIDKTQKT